MNAPLPVAPQAALQLLQQDTIHCQQLLTLLQSEHAVLQQRDTAQLRQIVEAKQTLMMKLEGSAKQRTRWVNAMPEELITSSETQTKWLALLNAMKEPALLDAWYALDGKLAECKAQNELNGRIINKGQRTLQQLVGLLRGKVANATNLYNAKGTTDQSKGPHTSVKA